jgi:hypothetical protein
MQLLTCCHRHTCCSPTARCAALLNQVWSDLAGLNIYNVLEECHHRQHPTTAAAGAAQADAVSSSSSSRLLTTLMAQPQQRVWPLTGVVRQGAVVKHWGQLLRHNPPCTQTR